MGKHKYLTVERVWELFEEYRDSVKKNPRIKVEYVGRDGDRVETPVERPLSMDGFYTYCYDQNITIHHYFDNPDGAYDDYRGIITRVRNAVRAEQIDGGMVGFYNSNLTARLNGLVDKQQREVIKEQPLLPEPPEENLEK